MSDLASSADKFSFFVSFVFLLELYGGGGGGGY